ncbi:hypothetical protein DFP72DRAFT_399923 [Ephemerocybe angulata]|uniref:Uncharacterized protein n=1 Tax=Ephemerocybe angulata TaxID=980116 RepID=A0A8H6HXG3_9AGAR|nr:hypothetical protein DFP72DRAFT_399860 [Tulosesus angulatus]KAF6753608.1 hypothetical protein DFP72DRAFT_399923 [Tulosesus angulatus]
MHDAQRRMGVHWADLEETSAKIWEGVEVDNSLGPRAPHDSDRGIHDGGAEGNNELDGLKWAWWMQASSRACSPPGARQLSIITARRTTHLNGAPTERASTSSSGYWSGRGGCRARPGCMAARASGLSNFRATNDTHQRHTHGEGINVELGVLGWSGWMQGSSRTRTSGVSNFTRH